MNTKTLETLITELESIAKKNQDQFLYRIGLRPLRDGGMEFSFICQDSADKHEFLVGYGNSIEDCILDAKKGIPDALKAWEYEYP